MFSEIDHALERGVEWKERTTVQFAENLSGGENACPDIMQRRDQDGMNRCCRC
jgi:hypothetical protein